MNTKLQKALAELALIPFSLNVRIHGIAVDLNNSPCGYQPAYKMRNGSALTTAVSACQCSLAMSPNATEPQATLLLLLVTRLHNPVTRQLGHNTLRLCHAVALISASAERAEHQPCNADSASKHELLYIPAGGSLHTASACHVCFACDVPGDWWW